MADPVARFYDDLANHYHLLVQDWDDSIAWQADCLQNLLVERLGEGPFHLLDASCGIGTQAIGLAQKGHKVSGSDLSPAAVARAKREAVARDLKISLTVADMRVLSGYHAGPFDATMIMDNSLAHLRNDDEILETLQQAISLLRPGGLFITSLRDFEALLEEHPSTTPPRVFDDKSGRRVVFQVLDWRSDNAGYRAHLFIQRQDSKDGPVEDTLHFATDSWCLEQERLMALMTEAGYLDCAWLLPEESGYYQPIVVGRRAG